MDNRGPRSSRQGNIAMILSRRTRRSVSKGTIRDLNLDIVRDDAELIRNDGHLIYIILCCGCGRVLDRRFVRTRPRRLNRQVLEKGLVCRDN